MNLGGCCRLTPRAQGREAGLSRVTAAWAALGRRSEGLVETQRGVREPRPLLPAMAG